MEERLDTEILERAKEEGALLQHNFEIGRTSGDGPADVEEITNE